MSPEFLSQSEPSHVGFNSFERDKYFVGQNFLNSNAVIISTFTSRELLTFTSGCVIIQVTFLLPVMSSKIPSIFSRHKYENLCDDYMTAQTANI